MMEERVFSFMTKVPETSVKSKNSQFFLSKFYNKFNVFLSRRTLDAHACTRYNE